MSYSKDKLEENSKSFSDLFTLLSLMKKSNLDIQNPEVKGLSAIRTNFEIVFNKYYTEIFDITERERYESDKITMSIPLTFFDDNNLWIIKASDLCQGNCLKICDDINSIQRKIKKFFSGIDRTYKDSDEELPEVQPEVQKNKELNKNNKKKGRYVSTTVILQKYLEKPLLYMNRKFDIRMWVLIDHELNVFLFKEGHLKCSSEDFNVKNKNQFVHITNYSVQKYSSNFGKFEFGNEVSFSDFQYFLDFTETNMNFRDQILPKIKRIIELTCYSVGDKLNKKGSKYCFEILGYDFIIDTNFDVWLLEINDSPGLSESSPLIKALVPRMIDDAFRLTIDKVFLTKFSEDIFIDNKYNSPFNVQGYSDQENLFEQLCNININKSSFEKKN